MKKLRDFLNRDIKEFNVKLLVLSGVLFIALMGFISYKLTNNSYALFTDTVTGTKTLTFNYTEDVYRYGEELAYLYSPLKSGTYNGYCGVKSSPASNTCTDDNYGYLTQNDCTTYVNNNNLSGTTCSSGSWTTSGITYTSDYTTLNKDVFLKHNIGSQTEVNESYVCYILDRDLYCLKGGDGVYNSAQNALVSTSYENNIKILDNSFGSSNCSGYVPTSNSNKNLKELKPILLVSNDPMYSCSIESEDGSLFAFAKPTGSISVRSSVNNSIVAHCDVLENGRSECHIY